MSIPWGRDWLISVSNRPSGFFRRNIERISKSPWPEERTVVLFIYWERNKYPFNTRIILFMQFCLKLHFWERETSNTLIISFLYAKVIQSLGMAWQLHKKRKVMSRLSPSHANTVSVMTASTRSSLPLCQSVQGCELWQQGDHGRGWLSSGQNWWYRDVPAHWCQQPLRWREKVIPCDLNTSTLFSNEKAEKVVFEVILASYIGMLGERVTKQPFGLKHGLYSGLLE